MFQSPFLRRFLFLSLTPTLLAMIVLVSMSYLNSNELIKFSKRMNSDLVFSSWNQMSTTYYNKAVVDSQAITRDSATKKAIRKKKIQDISDSLSPTFNRMKASNIIDYLEVYNKKGKLLFSAGGEIGIDLNGLVSTTIEGNKPIFVTYMNDKSLNVQFIYSFPIYIRGKPKAAAVYVKNVGMLLEGLSEVSGLNYGISYNGQLFFNNFIFDESLYSNDIDNVSHEGLEYSIIKVNLPMDNASGVKLIITKENTKSLHALKSYKIASFVVPVIALFSIALILLYVIKRISVVLNNSSQCMVRLSKRDFNINIPEYNRKDEFGDIISTLSILRDELQISYEKEAAEKIAQQKQIESAEKLQEIVRLFDHNVNKVVKKVMDSSSELSQASSMLDMSVSSSEYATSIVNEASAEASVNVQSASQDTQEMNDSIKNISEQISKTLAVISKAVESTETAIEKTATLEESASHIGDIVGIIRKIAGQTNLLAMNATIEAARAGEAGKGFAVVASEVKGLSEETAKATEQIAEQISEAQSISAEVVQCIDHIKSAINDVSIFSTNVSAAVEEQSAVTNNIVNNMDHTSGSVSSISENIVAMCNSVEQVKMVAESVSDSSNVLTDQADVLSKEVKRLCRDVKNI